MVKTNTSQFKIPKRKNAVPDPAQPPMKKNKDDQDPLNKLARQLDKVDDRTRMKSVRAYRFDYKNPQVTPLVSFGKVMVSSGIFTQEEWDAVEFDGPAYRTEHQGVCLVVPFHRWADREKVLRNSSKLKGCVNPDDPRDQKRRVVVKEDLSANTASEKKKAMTVRWKLMTKGWKVAVLGLSNMLMFNGKKVRAGEIDLATTPEFDPSLHKAEYGLPEHKRKEMAEKAAKENKNPKASGPSTSTTAESTVTLDESP